MEDQMASMVLNVWYACIGRLCDKEREKGCVQETNTTTSTTLLSFAMYCSKEVTVL